MKMEVKGKLHRKVAHYLLSGISHARRDGERKREEGEVELRWAIKITVKPWESKERAQ